MSDFRMALYDRYVSTFKGVESELSAYALSSYFAWCEYKFLPLLEGIGHDGLLLEVGCGPGYMLEFLKRCGFTEVHGIDISREQIQRATNRGCDAEVADVFEYLNGKPDTFDAILALDFIEHFHKEELTVLMPLLQKSLKQGGRLILQTPNGEGLFPHHVIYGDLTHLTILTPSSLQQLLRQAGFQGFHFHETGPAPKNLGGRLRLLLWHLIRFIASTIRRIETGQSQALWTENMICCCYKYST